MVKPQAKLRPTTGPAPVNPPPGVRVSTDSMNNQVPSRTTAAGRRREAVFEPDFIVVKAGPNYGDDTALAIVEGKNEEDGVPLPVDVDQILKYMASIFSKTPANDLKGYLVVRGTTYVYGLPAAPNIPAQPLVVINTATQLKTHLETVAHAHW